MNRESVTKSQTADNSALLPSSNRSRRKTTNRRSLSTPTIDRRAPQAPQTDASFSLLGEASPLQRNFSQIPVLLNLPYPIQAKLKIGQPNDKYEQEADRVTDQVMRMPDPRLSSLVGGSPLDNIAIPNAGSIQLACASCSGEYKKAEEENHSVQSASLCPNCRTQGQGLIQAKPITPFIQTKTSADLTPEVTPAIGAGIQSLRGGGQPLSQSERGFFEPRFGADFSAVRVHSDARAAGLARSVNARAFTHGHNVVFGAGEYSSGSDSGRRLLAHELTHVVQQSGSNKIGFKTSIESDSIDRDRGAGKVPSSFANPLSAIQRICGPAAIGTRTECDARGPTFVTGHRPFKFRGGCDDFDSAEEEKSLRTTAATLPASSLIEIHGYASTDGDPTFNENLSCARAVKAKEILIGAGIAAGRISIISHGPTPGPTAERRSVVIEAAAAPTPLTVAFSHIQATTSPAGMPDRIPPRVDTTVAVGIVGWRPPMPPVRLSIDGAGGPNGYAAIDGASSVDVTSNTTVKLRGLTQTTQGNANNLRLVAEQGGTKLATSNAFSVSAIPQNHAMVFNCLIPSPGCASVLSGDRRGFEVMHTWDSDSYDPTDLDQIDQCERVEFDSRSGSLAGISLTSAPCLGVGHLGKFDDHTTPAWRSAGSAVVNQTHMFKDLRSEAVDIPVTSSGYRIQVDIVPTPGSGYWGFFQDFTITTTKFGSANTTLGITSGAGMGRVSRTQRV